MSGYHTNKVIVLPLRPSLENVRQFFSGADPVLGSCSIQLLLATDFNNVPRDEATWNDIRGAARTVFRSCIQGKGLGGLVTKNGKPLT